MLMGQVYHCHQISEGQAAGEVLFSSDDFCFYLVDPATGIVIEKNHCLEGQCIAGKVLVFPNGKGSSVVQADGMYQLKLKGTAPQALIIQNPDTTLVASAIIMEMPMADRVDAAFYTEISNGDRVIVNTSQGTITVATREEAGV
jgi:predicted aconitase with swiveling domain